MEACIKFYEKSINDTYTTHIISFLLSLCTKEVGSLIHEKIWKEGKIEDSNGDLRVINEHLILV